MGRGSGRGGGIRHLCCRAQEQRGAWPLQACGQLASTSEQWLTESGQRSLLQALGGLGNESGVSREASRINMVAAETQTVGPLLCLD